MRKINILSWIRSLFTTPTISHVQLVSDQQQLVALAKEKFAALKLPTPLKFNQMQAHKNKQTFYYRNALMFHRQLETTVNAMEKSQDIVIDQTNPHGESSYYDWFVSDDEYMLDCVVFIEQVIPLWERLFTAHAKLKEENSTKLWYYENRSTALLTDSIVLFNTIGRILK